MTSAYALPHRGGSGRRCRPDWREAMAAYAMTGRGPGGHRHGPPWGGPGDPAEGLRRSGFGPGGFGGRGGRRRRMRRGDVRAALLVLLAEEPRNGYGLMQEIEQRSEGAWRPSPGSVYPALAQLEDEGLVSAGEVEGRKAYTLTDAGRTYVEEHREELGEPWKQAGEHVGEERLELRGLLWQLGSAAMQVATAGNDAQVAQARDILKDARRSLYRLLADDEDETTPEAGGPTAL